MSGGAQVAAVSRAPYFSYEIEEHPKLNYTSWPYAALNGRDATRALATMKINVSEEDEARGTEGLSEEEMKTLREWRDKFLGKYPVLGRFVRS